MQLYNSERKIMELLWGSGSLPAKVVAAKMQELTDWEKATTYAVIHTCIRKGYIRRDSPGFVCVPLLSREKATAELLEALLQDAYSGSAEQLILDLLAQKKLTPDRLKVLCAATDKEQ